MKPQNYRSGLFALLLTTALVSPSFANDIQKTATVSATKFTKAEETAGSLLPWAEVNRLYNQAVRKDGHSDHAIKTLVKGAADPSFKTEDRAKSLRLASLIFWKSGKLDKAVKMAAQAVEMLPNAENLYLLARTSDASGDIGRATNAYEKALKKPASKALADEIRLQLALISAMARDVAPFVKLANTMDAAQKNRIANTLALMQFPEQALSLYRPEPGNSKQAIVGHLRVAGWAIKAKDLPKAKAHSWQAAQLTVERREKLYALSLLVEAHRMDNSLDQLIRTFENAKSLSVEAREVWTDLLYETGRSEDALELFKSSGNGDFTPAERVKLIRMYQASGKDTAIVNEYRKLIKADPEEVYWHIGLSEYYAVKGLDRDAEKTWDNFIATIDEPDVLLAGAEAMSEMGFDSKAIKTAELAMKHSESPVSGLMFLFEHYLGRGQISLARTPLEKLDKYLPEFSAERLTLADSFERIKDMAKALAIWESLAQDPAIFGIDEKMRLAWLYRSLGRDEDSLRAWKGLQKEQLSPAVQSIVEQQIITLSAELGILGDLVFELEDKLSSGKATEGESSFLARIYIRVEDKVSAIEIIDEFFKLSGKNEIDNLKEQSKVYLLMGDYVNYGKVTERLIVIDPENKSDYLRDIILSKVELFTAGEVSDKKAKVAELKDLLGQLRADGKDGMGYQFEGGVLVLAKQDKDAIFAFRQAISDAPENGDNYLQLGDLLTKMGREGEALGLFQAVAAETGKEEVFAVAIDGILNTFSAASNEPNLKKRAKAILGWMQRMIYARLSHRADKFYYYQLLSDIISETGDGKAQIEILENSLAAGAASRMSVLRELITMTTPEDSPSFGASGKVKNQSARRKFGRRLIGLRLALPPSIYMSLAKNFLTDKDPFSAEKSVNKAVDVSGMFQLRAEAGAMFETDGYDLRAIEQYRRALVRDRDNFSLMVNVARLREKADQGQAANKLFGRSLEMLLSRQLQIVSVAPKVVVKDMGNYTRIIYSDNTKTREYKEYYSSILQGFMTTWQDDTGVMKDRLDRFEDILSKELTAILSKKADALDPIEKYSRLNHLAIFLRSVSLAAGDLVRADRIDMRLIQQFAYDEAFMTSLLLSRLDMGLDASAKTLAEFAGKTDTGLVKAAADMLAKRLSNHIASFEEQLEKAIATKEFDPVLNMAFASGDESKKLTVLRAWAQAGFYFEAFKWSKDNLDDSSHKSLSRYLVLLIRENESFFYKAFLGNLDFCPELEKASGEKIFTAEKLVVLSRNDHARMGLSGIASYVFSRLSTDAALSFLEESLEAYNDMTPIDILGRFWYGIYSRPWDKNSSERLVKVIKEVFSKTPVRGETMNMGGVTASLGGDLTSFEGSLTRLKGMLKENRIWVKDIIDTWRGLVGVELDLFRPIDLLYSGQTDAAVTSVIDTLLKVGEIHKGDSGKIGSYRIFYEPFFFPKYEDALKANIREREKKNGPSEIMSALYANLFFIDDEHFSAERVEFMKQKIIDHPKNPKYVSMLKTYLEKTELPWRSIPAMRRLFESDPDNAFYRATLFLDLIRADRAMEAMVLNGRGDLDMLSEGYFENLLNIALKQGLRPVEDHFGHGAAAGFHTGMVGREIGTDPKKKPVYITTRKLARAVVATDEKAVLNQLRALWQTVMKEKRPEWQDKERYEIEKLAAYKKIINLDWPDDISSPHQGRKLFDVMTDYKFSLKEFESFVRARKVDGSSGLNELYQYLAKTYEIQGLAEDKFRELSNKIISGDNNFGLDGFIFWLNLADRMKIVPSAAIMNGMERWYAARHSLPADILHMMSRLYSRAGQNEKLLTVYQALIDQSLYYTFPRLEMVGLHEYIYVHRGRMTALELVKEGVKYLEGDERQKLLAYILARANKIVGRDTRLGQMAELFTFDALRIALSPKGIAERLKKLTIKAADSHPINAVTLTGLYVKAGQFKQARDQLKTTVRLFSELRAKNIYELEGEYLHKGNEREGKIGQTFAELLGYPISYLAGNDPVALADIYAPVPAPDDETGWQWLGQAGDDLAVMINEPDMDREMIVDMMIDLASRLHRGGKTKAVKKILTHLSQAMKVKAFNGSMINKLYAFSRSINMPLDIGTAQWLLVNGQLDKAAILDTIDRIRKAEGPQEALTLAEAAANYTRFEGLLAVLVDLSRRAGANDKADDWEQERLMSAQIGEKLKQVLETAPKIPIY